MKVPGRAWLEFEVTGNEAHSTIRQTASFDPVGFDQGAQYFTIRDQNLKRYLESWIAEGRVAQWSGCPRVEGALKSGMSLAGRVLGALHEYSATRIESIVSGQSQPKQLTLFDHG
jgi:predicted NAD/FAD-dependent oxidoreductase